MSQNLSNASDDSFFKNIWPNENINFSEFYKSLTSIKSNENEENPSSKKIVNNFEENENSQEPQNLDKSDDDEKLFERGNTFLIETENVEDFQFNYNYFMGKEKPYIYIIFAMKQIINFIFKSITMSK